MKGKLVMTNEVIDEAYKVIAANGDKFLSSKDIYDAMNPAISETVNYDTFRSSFGRRVKLAHPDIRSVKGCGYTITGEDNRGQTNKTIKPAAEVKTDPNDSKRIGGEITKYIKDIHEKAGDVWTVRHSDGRIDYFLEMARNDVNVIGVPLYLCDEDPTKSTCWKEPYDVAVKVPHGWLFGNAMNIKTKPRKYFIEKYEHVSDEWFTYVKGMISTVLDISKTEVKEVEKVVERVAEPVKIAPIAVESITVDGVTYTKDDLISLITERDMYQMFYKDILSLPKGGRS